MPRQANSPKIIAIDSEGRSSRVKAERLEVEFSDGRRLLLSFPSKAWGDIEVEADTVNEADVPVISVQPAACNVLTLRVDVHHDMIEVDSIDLRAQRAERVRGGAQNSRILHGAFLRSCCPKGERLSGRRIADGAGVEGGKRLEFVACRLFFRGPRRRP